MITLDLGGLTLLKSFALIRSRVRYYGYKMSNAAGISRKSSRQKEKKFRRRKEWREEVEKATNFEEYCDIELYEPQHAEKSGDEDGTDKNALNRIASRGTEEVKHENGALSPITGFGLRKRHNKQAEDIRQLKTKQHLSPRRSTETSINSSQPASPNSAMRKIHSCLDLQHSPSNSARLKLPSPVKRVSSTASLSDSTNKIKENCPKWQRIVKEDLGMAGDMLITTMSRLREARIQASSSVSISSSNVEFDNNNSSSSEIINGSYSRQHTHDEDYSSSLKFLLSGIIKRNHLSVDDALINDCRSIAERGQHSLCKETRDAIDSYGDEVERCMDWVAKGTIQLGASANSVVADAEDIITREQVMQRQLEELEKRYTLVKRMKQNMGHTALMLSGGGGEFFFCINMNSQFPSLNIFTLCLIGSDCHVSSWDNQSLRRE